MVRFFNAMKKIILGTIVLVTTSCTSLPKIYTDYDQNYDRSKYKTYKLEQPEIDASPSQLSLNPILFQRIERAIHTSLGERGMKESPEPDMVIRYFIGTQREIDRSYDSFGYYQGNSRRGYMVNSDVRHRRVDRDVLSIRFHDRITDEVFWYAFSRYNRLPSEQDQASINSFVDSALEKFSTNQ